MAESKRSPDQERCNDGETKIKKATKLDFVCV